MFLYGSLLLIFEGCLLQAGDPWILWYHRAVVTGLLGNSNGSGLLFGRLLLRIDVCLPDYSGEEECMDLRNNFFDLYWDLC